MSNRQRRPLNGGLGNGTPTQLTGVAATIHTTDATAQAKGGPYVDEVTLFVANTDAAPKNVTVSVGGIALTVAVPANSFVKVLDGQPLVGSQAATPTPVVITALDATGGATDPLLVWGYFER